MTGIVYLVNNYEKFLQATTIQVLTVKQSLRWYDDKKMNAHKLKSQLEIIKVHHNEEWKL